MRFIDRRSLLVASAAIAAGIAFGRTGWAQVQGGVAARNVINTLAADGRFNQFIEMVGRAGFTDQLRGPGPVTLFAPTDSAMSGAPAARIADLMSQGTGGSGGGTLSGGSPDMVRLRAFLEYYAVPGLVTVSMLSPNQRLKTINGQDLMVVAAPAGSGGAFALTNPAPGQQSAGFGAAGINVMPPATIVQPDVRASNGIIHVLGGPLFP